MSEDKIEWSREITQCGNYLDRFSGYGKNQREYLSQPAKKDRPSNAFKKGVKKPQVPAKKVAPEIDDAKWIEERKKRFPSSNLSISKSENKTQNFPVVNKPNKTNSETERKKTLFEKLMD